MRDFSVLSRRDVLRMAGAVGGLAVTGAGEVWAQSARKIESMAPELDRIIGTSEPIRELATGYGGDIGPAEGPLWWAEGRYLLFNDIHTARRMKYTPGAECDCRDGEDQRSQWHHPRPAGPPRLRRTSHQTGDALRARRQPHRHRQQLPGQASAAAERRDREVRRVDLFHRPWRECRARAVGRDDLGRLSRVGRSRLHVAHHR